MNYWEESVRTALEDCGLKASEGQIDSIVGAIESSHENYGAAFGHDAIPNPLAVENAELRRDLKSEQDKITCPECRGRGEITINGPARSASSTCSACRGEGRLLR